MSVLLSINGLRNDGNIAPWFLALVFVGALLLLSLAAGLKWLLFRLLAPKEKNLEAHQLIGLGAWEFAAAAVAILLAFLRLPVALPGSAYFLLAFFAHLRVVQPEAHATSEQRLAPRVLARAFVLSALFPGLCLVVLFMMLAIWPAP